VRAPTRRRGQRPQSLVIVVLLLLTLGLAGVLAHQAHRAATSHREAVENTLRDYAAFAAWKYAGGLRNDLHWYFTTALKSLGHAETLTPERPLPDPHDFALTLRKLGKHEDATGIVQSYFSADLWEGWVRTRGSTHPAPLRQWVRDTIPEHARAVYDPEWTFAVLVRSAGSAKHDAPLPMRMEAPRAVVYSLGREDERVRSVVGFELDPDALRPILRWIGSEGTLLPPSLIGSMPTDSLMAISVTDADGREIFHSPVRYPEAFAASDTVGSRYGGLTVHVAIRPEVAERLVIGGVPKSRLPLLVGLLGLTAGLVGMALLQHRREYELAALRAEFVSNVSHELRTPLAQIRMFAETLLLGRVRSAEERRRSLEIVDQEARRLTHLVENVLLFSRAERGAVRLAPEPTELTGLVREVVDGFLPLALARQVTIRTELAEGLVVCVDRNAMRQILLNLLDNAVKYGPPGQTVTVATAAAGDCARIRVDDQGPGIPSRDRRRVWERFWRMAREEQSAVAGTGIGLAVVRELTTQHGGRAWCEDAPGGGARFLVELPRAQPAAAGAPEAAASNGGQQAADAQASDAQAADAQASDAQGAAARPAASPSDDAPTPAGTAPPAPRA
jgi:signal transduction histidine kinase